ncbi:chromatin binding protein ortholog [Schizosaccharomyces pombe]|uniref:Uncharacterized protein C21C3.14c n=1 Tax=Schizosaccharomyces pombe (strain 972 / ATCC 24843) TaxID=284812 RepID=YOSE_SCHPO|nr:uncharacterized protein SPBC21C3.14c [Schizosaccharomyces pombe]Q9P7L0.1 RecName: Full=Uncharacterized protein C21C3.14c; Flags: Precursor [Schizosaccharomyces pombe 972h-]CAB76050.1 sequence orphan [Schizosaccharomyces pombe]|eukprot:NP_596594.1 uncharacterized protein SPBC21C3.14c [Schizosaccharomyces pombe]
MKIERYFKAIARAFIITFLFSLILQDNGVLARKAKKQDKGAALKSIYDYHVRPYGTVVQSQIAKASPIVDAAKQATVNVKSYYDEHAKPKVENIRYEVNEVIDKKVAPCIKAFNEKARKIGSKVLDGDNLRELYTTGKERIHFFIVDVLIPFFQRVVQEVRTISRDIAEKLQYFWEIHAIPAYHHYKPIIQRGAMDGYMQLRYVFFPAAKATITQMIETSIRFLRTFLDMHIKPQLQHIYESVVEEKSEAFASATSSKILSEMSASMASSSAHYTSSPTILSRTKSVETPVPMEAAEEEPATEYSIPSSVTFNSQNDCFSNAMNYLEHEYETLVSTFTLSVSEHWEDLLRKATDSCQKELEAFEEISNLRVLAVENSLGNLIQKAEESNYDQAIMDLFEYVKDSILRVHERAIKLRTLSDSIRADVAENIEMGINSIREQAAASSEVALAACSGIKHNAEQVNKLNALIQKVYSYITAESEKVGNRYGETLDNVIKQHLSRIGSVASSAVQRLTAVKNSHKLKMVDRSSAELPNFDYLVSDQVHKIVEINDEHADCDDVNFSTASFEIYERSIPTHGADSERKILKRDSLLNEDDEIFNDLNSDKTIKTNQATSTSSSNTQEISYTGTLNDNINEGLSTFPSIDIPASEADNVYSILPIDVSTSEAEGAYSILPIDVPKSVAEETYSFLPSDVPKSEAEKVYSILPIDVPQSVAEETYSFKPSDIPESEAEKIYSILPIDVKDPSLEKDGHVIDSSNLQTDSVKDYSEVSRADNLDASSDTIFSVLHAENEASITKEVHSTPLSDVASSEAEKVYTILPIEVPTDPLPNYSSDVESELTSD